MSLQKLKNQADKWSVSDRLKLVSAIVKPLQGELRLRPNLPGVLGRMGGLAKTDALFPNDAAVAAIL